MNREFDEIGADYNACTTEESTVFYAAVLPDQVDRTVDLLGDILRPALRPEDFEMERQVILEEIQMYEDQPPFGADEKCRAVHFGSHPLAHSVLGTSQSVSRLPVDAMRDYFLRRYTPENVVLVGAGRIDFESLTVSAQACVRRLATGLRRPVAGAATASPRIPCPAQGNGCPATPRSIGRRPFGD